MWDCQNQIPVWCKTIAAFKPATVTKAINSLKVSTTRPPAVRITAASKSLFSSIPLIERKKEWMKESANLLSKDGKTLQGWHVIGSMKLKIFRIRTFFEDRLGYQLLSMSASESLKFWLWYLSLAVGPGMSRHLSRMPQGLDTENE